MTVNPSAPRLSELLADLAPVAPEAERAIIGLSCGSRALQAGDLFLALRGERRHGLDFLGAAYQARAAAVAWEPPYDGMIAQNPACPLIAVPELSRWQGLIADRFYGAPARAMRLIGVTGTDGKTSCTHFIAQCLQTAAAPCGLLGTLGYGIYGALAADEFTLTTPDAITLRRWLAAARTRGARYAALEVSSHALAQARVAGLEFAVAVLTNLTRDHLDYHGDLAAYAAAKRRLFIDHCPAAAVLNLDDAFGRELATEFNGPVIGYSLAEPAAGASAIPVVRGAALRLTAAGIELAIQSPWGAGTLRSALVGRFNASNLLAALATLLALDEPFTDALARLERVTTAPGRMERLSAGHTALAVIDYAHTPHALEQALRALRAHTAGQLWCVFGCGGERDPGKRPLMGACAEQLADHVIITNDNPRAEDPVEIARHIQTGMQHPNQVTVMLDRAQAITHALALAAVGDCVLIAGKGHESYQILGERRIAFSDRAVVQGCLERAA